MFQNAITGLLEQTELTVQLPSDRFAFQGRPLLRHRPRPARRSLASDMREVVSAMKIGGHLEQTADECVTIVRPAKKLNYDAVLLPTILKRRVE
jgi:hypothetical protein